MWLDFLFIGKDGRVDKWKVASSKCCDEDCGSIVATTGMFLNSSPRVMLSLSLSLSDDDVLEKCFRLYSALVVNTVCVLSTDSFAWSPATGKSSLSLWHESWASCDWNQEESSPLVLRCSRIFDSDESIFGAKSTKLVLKLVNTDGVGKSTKNQESNYFANYYFELVKHSPFSLVIFISYFEVIRTPAMRQTLFLFDKRKIVIISNESFVTIHNDNQHLLNSI